MYFVFGAGVCGTWGSRPVGSGKVDCVQVRLAPDWSPNCALLVALTAPINCARCGTQQENGIDYGRRNTLQAAVRGNKEPVVLWLLGLCSTDHRCLTWMNSDGQSALTLVIEADMPVALKMMRSKLSATVFHKLMGFSDNRVRSFYCAPFRSRTPHAHTRPSHAPRVRDSAAVAVCLVCRAAGARLRVPSTLVRYAHRAVYFPTCGARACGVCRTLFRRITPPLGR